jgi:hypothetical protein
MILFCAQVNDIEYWCYSVPRVNNIVLLMLFCAQVNDIILLILFCDQVDDIVYWCYSVLR